MLWVAGQLLFIMVCHLSVIDIRPCHTLYAFRSIFTIYFGPDGSKVFLYYSFENRAARYIDSDLLNGPYFSGHF